MKSPFVWVRLTPSLPWGTPFLTLGSYMIWREAMSIQVIMTSQSTCVTAPMLEVASQSAAQVWWQSYRI